MSDSSNATSSFRKYDQNKGTYDAEIPALNEMPVLMAKEKPSLHVVGDVGGKSFFIKKYKF